MVPISFHTSIILELTKFHTTTYIYTETFLVCLSVGNICHIYVPELFVCMLYSVDGQHVNQGKLGAAVLANHTANDVSIDIVELHIHAVFMYMTVYYVYMLWFKLFWF